MSGFERGIPIMMNTRKAIEEQLDMIRKMSQTSRNETIALYVCLEEPIGVEDAIRKYMENK